MIVIDMSFKQHHRAHLSLNKATYTITILSAQQSDWHLDPIVWAHCSYGYGADVKLILQRLSRTKMQD